MTNDALCICIGRNPEMAAAAAGAWHADVAAEGTDGGSAATVAPTHAGWPGGMNPCAEGTIEAGGGSRRGRLAPSAAGSEGRGWVVKAAPMEGRASG